MEELNAVHDFLIRRTAMKRLGLRFECEPEDVFIIWQVLVEMKFLEGLWLEVLSNRLIDIVPLMPVLPASLRALMFSALVHPDDAEEFVCPSCLHYPLVILINVFFTTSSTVYLNYLI